MKYIKNQTFWVIRLEKGEEILKVLHELLKSNKIINGIFWGLGAISYAKLSSYQLDQKQYLTKEFNEPMEISNLVGNIVRMDDEIKIHCHAVFGKVDFSTISGHLDEAVVAATCEIILMELPFSISRKFDKEIGLNLLDF